ncbi:MAG: Hpt domain-containing protein [Planctomycetota bacterium]
MENSDQQWIDMGVIEELLEMDDGDSGLLTDLIEMFLDDGMQRLEDIQRELAAGDLDAVMQAAHRLKGSAGNLGLTPLAHLADELQIAGRGGDEPKSRELLESIGPAFEESGKGLRQLLLTYSGGSRRM